MHRRRARTQWWSQEDVEAASAQLTVWNEDGTLSEFGTHLTAVARTLAEVSISPGTTEEEIDLAESLATVAVLDGLSDWTLDTAQKYVTNTLRPDVPWPSIAGATNRAPDAARMRFDSRQFEIQQRRLSNIQDRRGK